jgi:hypothetical protein
MEVSSIIIDNFYLDPYETREYALSQEFDVPGNYPGRRTKSIYNQSVFDIIQNAVSNAGGKITRWDMDQYTGSFQYTTSRDRSWIHADQTTTWAGVCYLTPNAPLSSGTGLFRHIPTGLECAPRNSDGNYNFELLNKINLDSQDMTKWELTDRLANKFNRLVLYRGDFFHMSLDYFGQDKYDGRLFQTFFFDTER